MLVPLVVSACGARSCGAGSGHTQSGGADAGARAAAPSLVVPHASGPVHVDGEVDEPDWSLATRTGPFVDAAGHAARPYSEARLLHDEAQLYLVLYAADEDIEVKTTAADGPVWLDDAFSISIRPIGQNATYHIDVSATGVVTDVVERGAVRDASWQSGIRVAVDRDGTVNDPRDDDEEWVVEAAIPLAPLGVAQDSELMLGLRRCDTPRGGRRSCGGWGDGTNRGDGGLVRLAPR